MQHPIVRKDKKAPEVSKSTTYVFKVCPHKNEIKNYCHKCKVFGCDECTMDHLDHIEAVDTWENYIKEYLMKCKTNQTRARLLLKKTTTHSTLNEVITQKINEKFVVLHAKLEDYKQQLIAEIWKSVSEERTETEFMDDNEFKKIFQQLEDMIQDTKAFRKSGDLTAQVKSLQKSKLKDVEKQIDLYQKVKENVEKQNRKETENFRLIDDFTYPNIRELIRYSLTGHSKDVTEEFCFPEHPGNSRAWKKIHEIWYSMSCNHPLPKYFKASFKIRNFTRHTFGFFGISKSNFKTHGGGSLAWMEGQWACTENGYITHFNKGNKEELGNGCLNDNGDIITLVLQKDGHLTFWYNGEKQEHGFQLGEDAQGPFYLAASLFYKDSEIEIVEVLELV